MCLTNFNDTHVKIIYTKIIKFKVVKYYSLKKNICLSTVYSVSKYL